jgi:hypothetical protein
MRAIGVSSVPINPSHVQNFKSHKILFFLPPNNSSVKMSDTFAVRKAQLAAKKAEVDKAMQEEMEAIAEEERLEEERARLERERKAAEEKAERERKEAEAKSKGKRKAVDEGAKSGLGLGSAGEEKDHAHRAQKRGRNVFSKSKSIFLL